MIQFRTFRNTDPPALVDIWNESFTGRGAFHLRAATLFEHCLFAKSYFDPAGLLVAADESNQAVGFAHAGFGPNAAETQLSSEVGIICTLAVRPSHRRQKIGSRLLKLSEEYLRGHGANQIVAGSRR